MADLHGGDDVLDRLRPEGQRGDHPEPGRIGQQADEGRRLADGQDLPDVVDWLRYSGVSWTKDGEGFFYTRYPRGEERPPAESGPDGAGAEEAEAETQAEQEEKAHLARADMEEKVKRREALIERLRTDKALNDQQYE